MTSLSECSVVTAIRGVLSNVYKTFKGLSFIKKANVVVNVINIAINVKEFITGDTIWNKIKAAGNIVLCLCNIYVTMADFRLCLSMIIGTGLFGIGNDIVDIIVAFTKKPVDWWGVVAGLGMLILDGIFMFFDIQEENANIIKDLAEQAKIVRTPIQKKMIDVTMEIMKKGGVTQETKDILLNFAMKNNIDSFEDVWNLVYHLCN